MLLNEKTRTIAVLSVMAALSTVLAVLGTLIAVNTLFFTAAAAFLAGIAVCRYGMKYGILYFCVCLALDFIINPDKLHVLLYLALAGYLLLSEGTWMLLSKSRKTPAAQPGKKKIWLHRLIRLMIFAAIYLPFLFLAPQVILSGDLLKASWYRYAMIPVGVVVWVIYDLAYFAAKKFIRQRFHNAMK